MTKQGLNYSFDSITSFSVAGGIFCQWKRISKTVLSISENLRVKSKGHQITIYGYNWSYAAITLSQSTR